MFMLGCEGQSGGVQEKKMNEWEVCREKQDIMGSNEGKEVAIINQRATDQDTINASPVLEISRSFTSVNILKPHCENTPLQVKALDLKKKQKKYQK